LIELQQNKEMPMQLQTQSKLQTEQPLLTPIPIDPNYLLKHGNSPTAIILAITILLYVIRPVMMKRR
jgi:hypothetical protein